jgi:sulfoquinovose isomerase
VGGHLTVDGWWTDPVSELPDHAWLDAEARRLLAFARGARLSSGGFGWLGDDGRVDADRPLELWINARITYVFTLAHLWGEPDAATYADHGLAALTELFRDAEHGGWLSRLGGAEEGRKAAYDHAFVLLASAAGTVAERPGARALLDEAVAVVEERFWVEEEGALLDTWDAAWREPEPYRGANANMHGVEAFLAVADATGDGVWVERAARIAARLVGEARDHDGRVPEHHDAEWRAVLDFNRERPGDPFRPYGATVGHGLEWSRLVLQLHAAGGGGEELVEDARLLFDAAVRDGWAVDGAPGFVYTVDWDGTPVVRERMHWVVAEAVLAAAAQGRDDLAAEWWAYAREHLVDETRGSWHHELDPQNRPASTVWSGKPDVYHAFQACLLPRLPLHPSPAAALA